MSGTRAPPARAAKPSVLVRSRPQGVALESATARVVNLSIYDPGGRRLYAKPQFLVRPGTTLVPHGTLATGPKVVVVWDAAGHVHTHVHVVH